MHGVTLNHRSCGYRDVAESLRDQIRSGAISVGSLLPTERELVECFRVSRTTVRRALAHMVTTGWAESIPNRGVSARLGRTSRRQVVGFVDYASIFAPHLFFSLNTLLQARGLVLTHVDSFTLGTEGALEYCVEQRFAGAVVWSKTINPNESRLRKVLQSIPVVAVDHALRGIETDVVSCDVFNGAKAAIRHLASVGHRQIGIMGMLDSLDTTQERFAGYLEGMFEAGLQPLPRDFLFTRTSGSGPDIAHLVRRLSEPDAPTALFVMQDHMMEDLTHAAVQAGISIPTDVAVVTMGSDEPFAPLSQIGLTTVAFDWPQMAEVLRDRLCARFSDPGTETTRSVIPAELMVRGSCGAPRERWTEQPPLPISSTLRARAGGRGSSEPNSAPTFDRWYRLGGTPMPSSLTSTSR